MAQFCCRSASLCSGELHPDNVVHKEQSLKAMKKAYYSNVEKYHIEYVVLLCPFDTIFCNLLFCSSPSCCATSASMIGNLQMWKEKWSSCMDHEVDIVQNIWRLFSFLCLLLCVCVSELHSLSDVDIFICLSVLFFILVFMSVGPR